MNFLRKINLVDFETLEILLDMELTQGDMILYIKYIRF